MSTSNHWYEEDIAGSFVAIARQGHEEGNLEARKRLVFNCGVMDALKTRIYHEARRCSHVRLSIRDYANSVGARGCRETPHSGRAALDEMLVWDFLAGFGVWLITDDRAFESMCRTAIDIPDFGQYRKVLIRGITVRNLLHSFFRKHLDAERRRRDVHVYDGVIAADGGGESAARQRDDAQRPEADAYQPAPWPSEDALSGRFARLRELVVERIRDDDDRERALGLMLLSMPMIDTWELCEADTLRGLFPRLGEGLVDGCQKLIRDYGDRIEEHARLVAGHEEHAASSRAKIVDLARERQRNPAADTRADMAERIRRLTRHVRLVRAQEESMLKVELISETSLAALLGVDTTQGRNALKRAKRLFRQLAASVYPHAGKR